MSIITDLSGVNEGDIICSVCVSPSKKWVRELKDIDGNIINIHKLIVERSLNSNDKWIICLNNRIPENNKHVFYLNFLKIKVRKWSVK